jgi:hypothetical protein
MNVKTAIDPRHAEILVHMLGAGNHVRKANHGYRNHYCAGLTGDDYQTLIEMCAAGLVMPGPIINEGCDRYFFATRQGCEAIGLGKAATMRAMKD